MNVKLRDRLDRLIAGDVIFAVSPNGATVIGLISHTDTNYLYGRNVTTQMRFVFSKSTGIESPESEIIGRIASIAPLPAFIYSIVLGMDRKFRISISSERLFLDEDERKALLFLDDYYIRNPL